MIIIIRIVKDFYLAEPDLAKRPKIFGMTASPVDAKVDVVQAAKYLSPCSAVHKLDTNKC